MRIEKDSMGEMQVEDSAYYGASTQRAVLNFQISKRRLPRSFIKAIGLIKLCSARVNNNFGWLSEDKLNVISAVCQEVIDGKLDAHFVVDVFQTGSGTSTNMNANEVIANRAIEVLGLKKGEKKIHANDDVNMSQSSNDVIPTAMHISAMTEVCHNLIPNLTYLQNTLEEKAKEFAGVIKSGRTHLQDATPITLGQEFSGYARQIQLGIQRLERANLSIRELALGGTAVGTGLNTHPDFAPSVIKEINAITNLNFIEAENHFEAQGARDAIVELSGQLKTIACSLMKISNDIRWLGAGPRCNLAEIQLPEIQPGSSIMPAKVNPVICEAVMMVCAQVIGNDACCTVCGQHGNFELNVMMPVMADNVLESIELLSSVSRTFVDKCISGIKANTEKCAEYANKSLAICTALAPIIGYDQAAKLAKQAYQEDKTIRELLVAQNVMKEDEINSVLDLFAMTKPSREV